MKPKIFIISFITILVIAAGIFYFLNIPPANHITSPGDASDDGCLYTYTIDEMGASARDYIHEIHKITDSSDKTIRAVKVQDEFTPVNLDFNKKLKNGNYLLYFDRNDEPVLNYDLFTDIKIVDATNIEEKLLIGTYKDTTFSELSPLELIEFLIKSHLITTYWHINAELCLSGIMETSYSELNEINIYNVTFNAEHEYCTNECVTANYDFEVEIDRLSGDIWVGPVLLIEDV